MATTLARWTLALHAALKARAIAPEPLFIEAGIDPALLADPDARVPIAATSRLWRLAVAATGDCAIGLSAARFNPTDGRNALAVNLLSSRTLWHAMTRMARYIAVVTELAELDLRREPGIVRLRVLSQVHEPAAEAIDALTYSVVRLCRALVGRAFAPRLLRLRRAAPFGWREYSRVFRCPVSFAAEVDELLFDEALFDRELDAGNAALAGQQDRILESHLAAQVRANVVDRARQALAQSLCQGEPAADMIAARLGLTRRTLQRHLQAAGTSYKSLLDDTRRELARSYLQDAKLGVSDIAFLLGYTHAASFTHAHVRWTGQPPRASRPLPALAIGANAPVGERGEQ